MMNHILFSSIFKNTTSLCLIILYAIVLPSAIEAKADNLTTISWHELAELPPGANSNTQYGLASPFSGISNGALIVAGGCNFPETPVYQGGKKRYYDDIFVLEELEGKWKQTSSLPFKVAYGASVTLPDGLLCIGGKNIENEFERVIKLSWNNAAKSIVQEEWPSLPYSMSEHTAALVDKYVYVAAGRSNGQLANNFLRIDITKKGTDKFQWEVLPSFPGPARLQAAGIGQNAAEEAHFYLVSGSSFPPDADLPLLSSDILEFDPKTNEWTSQGQILSEGSSLKSLHGSAGIPIGVHHMIFIGGVDYDIFRKAWLQERQFKLALSKGDSAEINSLNKAINGYFTQPPDEYRFNDRILAFHTITGQWTDLGAYSYQAPAGAPVVKWQGGFAVISGEIKPGVRSPKVYFGRIQSDPQFGWLNWTVLLVYLSGLLFLGYFFMKRENSTEDFFKGGERIPWWAAGMSIFATMLSAITYMAIPAKTYMTNWLYFPMAITILLIAFPVMKYYLPFFRRLNVTTAYEYLELRFNYSVRLLASAIFIIFMIARMALVLFLPSLALTTVAGIDIYICIALMGVVTLIYCTMGGVEAVIWGDVIQGFVLLGGALLTVAFLITEMAGGWNELIEITVEHEKMKILDLSFDLTTATFWVIFFGGAANNLISYSSDQAVIQRYLTTKNEKSASRGILMNGVMSVAGLIVFYFIGTALFAYFTSKPQELDITMENPDSIFPYFIMTNLPVGIAGLLIAAIFAATMSTVSSNINSMSTAFTTDIYKKAIHGKADRHYLRVARISGLIKGGTGVIVALMMAKWNILSLFDYFNYILGLMTSGLGALFFMGIFLRRIGSVPALIGFLFGMASLVFISQNTDLHFFLYGLAGMVISVLVALLLSLFIKTDHQQSEGLTYTTISK